MQAVVRRPKRLIGDVTPPGDKSISHRSAIFNGIAHGEARVENYGTGAGLASSLLPRLVDEVPVLALAACFASGTTVIRDAAELRTKESDRLMASRVELSRLGADVEEMEEGLRITGGRALTGATHRTYADHRIAMTLGAAGLLAGGSTTMRAAEPAAVSYPSLWEDLESMRNGA